MNVVHIIFLFPIVTPPLTWLFQLEHLYVYDARGFSIGTLIYLNVVHIIFVFRRREASIYVPMSVGRSVGRLVGRSVGLQKILKNKKDEVSRVI